MNMTIQWLLAGVLGLAALLVLAGLAYGLIRAKRCPACPPAQPCPAPATPKPFDPNQPSPAPATPNWQINHRVYS